MDISSAKRPWIRTTMAAVSTAALLFVGLVNGTPVLAQTPPGGQPAVPPATGAPAAQAPFTVTWTRTDSLGNQVFEGDTLTWRIRVTNRTGRVITAYPAATNVQGVQPEAVPNCRWERLPVGDSYNCDSAKHVVTKADVEAKIFTPTITFNATTDRAGQQVVTPGEPVTGTPVRLSPGTRRDPLETPTDRVDGEAIVLGADGNAGFTCHRIPALTSAPNGWILAAWDGRPGGCGDAPQANSIVQRISKDGGKSWGPIKTVAAGKPAAPKFGYSDPSYVVDRETGDIFMFFVKSFDQGLVGSVSGTDPNNRNILHAAVMKSTNNGETWSEPQVITEAITADASWHSRFAASGEGIQKQYAPHKGRLIQQYTILSGGGDRSKFQAVSVYSDDHGTTWKVGTPVGSFMDENKVVELENGDVMLNSRSSKNGEKARRVAISKDGGVTYGDVHVDYNLVDPQNNAAIIRAFPDAAPGTPDSKILLFSNARNPNGRANGHITVSFDNGETWSDTKSFDGDGMAYSTITHLRDAQGQVIPGKYAILYEEPYRQIKHMPISWEWLGFLRAQVQGNDREAQRGVLKFTFTVTNNERTAISQGTFRPDPIPGWTWRTPSVPVASIPPGESVPVEVVAEVGNLQNSGPTYVTGRFTTENGASSAGYLVATFKLVGNQHEAGCAADLRVANADQLPAQNEAEGVAKILDKRPETIWHTPYNTTVALPTSIDFQLPYSAGLKALVLTPRADSDNGKINEAELVLVKDGQEISLEGRKALGADPSFNLAGLGTHATVRQPVTLRVKVHSTLGTTKNKWISLSEACVVETDSEAPTYDETATNPGGQNPGGQNPGGPVPPAPNTPAPIVPGPQPTPGDDTRPAGRTITRFSGESRVETAVKIAQEGFAQGAETVILARADVAADSVAATSFAKAINAPILVTQSDALHPAVAAQITALKTKKVIVMGGSMAISAPVEDAVAKLGVRVERVAGVNRADTAVLTARKLHDLGKATAFLVTDGGDWQSALVAGVAAAKADGAVLLTNGAAVAPETAAFLAERATIPVTAIGDAAKQAMPSATAITGADGTDLSVKVANAFFKAPTAVGIATTQDFADALTGGAHIARKQGPLLLVPASTPVAVSEWVKANAALKEVVVYGGERRISQDHVEALTK